MKQIAIIAVLLLSSCTCQNKLKRLLKRCPDLVKGDTITLIDTVVIPSVEVDSVFYFNQKDTIIIKEGLLTVKYFYNNHDSTVYLNGRCDTIVRIIERQVPTNTIIQKRTFFDLLSEWWWLPVAALLIIAFTLILNKLK